MTTPPGVTTATRRPDHAELDPATGPATWLMREDGSQVCVGHRPVDVWDLDAHGCPCQCHQPEPVHPARSTP